MSSGVGDVKFYKIVSDCLDEGNTECVLDLFCDNKEEVCKYAWELVSVVCRFLTEHQEAHRPEVFKCCQKLVSVIAEQAQPEDVLLQFIEEIETSESNTKVLVLLKPLEKVLLKVPDKRVTSLAWGFNAIKTYLNKLETPDEMTLVGEERLLLDNMGAVIKITLLYNELLEFCTVLIDEWLNLDETGNICERKQIIAKFLVELCGKPLAHLNMDIYKTTQPQARTVAQKVVKTFSRIASDPFAYVDMHPGSPDSDLIKPTNFALGAFYYLVLAQEMCTYPRVYERAYVLNHSLKFVNSLLMAEDQYVVEKGLHLMSSLLKNVDTLELDYLWLDSEHPRQFCLALSNIILHNHIEEVRKKGLQILQTFLWRFDHKGRYLLMMNLLPNVSHSGLRGFIVTQFKDMITYELRNANDDLPIFYKGPKLCSLLNEFTVLSQREETDLVDRSDQIVSTLNLLRFLVIADKANVTGIDDYVDELDEGYFKQLKTGSELSKEHYRLKIKEVIEEKTEKLDCKISVNVSGQLLPEMPRAKKLEILNLSLTTLDMIDSLRSRLIECIKIKKHLD